MSEQFNKAKAIAEKLVNLEIERKGVTGQIKDLKSELMDIISTNSIDSHFEFNNGRVYVKSTTKWEFADGLKEETRLSSKSPDKLSQDVIDEWCEPKIGLSKRAKVALREENTDLLSLLNETTKDSIKIEVE